MPRIERPGGLTLTFPPSYEAVDAAAAPGPRRSGTRGPDRRRPRALPSDAADDPLLEALARNGLEVAAEAELQPAGPAGTRGRTRGGSGAIELSLPVEPGMEAVVLTEQDGVYAWTFPEPEPEEETGGERRRTRGLGAHAPRIRTFRVNLPEGEAPSGPRTRGFIGDVVVGRVRTFVLRFVARAVTGRIIDHVERDIRTGAVHLATEDAAAWAPVDRLDLPSDRPARLLLAVHGTFSSTRGAYGALGSAPWGRELLGRARRAYDAVLGFDHRTLGADPRTNATELLRFLGDLDLARPPRIDVLTHSRGGLVFRSLAEQVLPDVAPERRPRIERAIFVGVPNAGTTLADPEHWRAFIDLYTNIALGACRFIGRLPQAKAVTTILAELIQGVGGLVKALAEQALGSGDVPGLAAMRPGGDFLRELNRPQPGQPGHDATFYCAVTSEFRASLGEPHAPPELPRRLLMGLVDRLSHRVLGAANDLVVNTASMTEIDGGGPWIKDRLHFDRTPHIYHTNYFARPEVVTALGRWLSLDDGATVALGSAGPLPARVSTDLVLASSDTTLAELRDQLEAASPAFVVVRRPYEGRVLRYALRRGEVDSRMSGHPATESLLDGLNLHEFEASAESTAAAAGRASLPAPGPGGPTTGRIVVLDDGVPVGVIAPDDEVPRSSDDLLAGTGERTMAPPPPAPPPPASAPPAPRSRGGGLRGGSRSRGRGLEEAVGAEPPPAPAPVAEPEVGRLVEKLAECHFQAEMPDAVAVDETATVAVTVSREAFDAVVSHARDLAAATVATDRPLVIHVRPRRNFEVVGEARAEVPVPAPGQPVDLYFDVRATHEGAGELWVVVRQGGPHELATLRLAVEVTARAPARRGAARAEASAPQAPVGARPLCQLRIYERDNGPEISHEYELNVPGRVFEVFRSAPMRIDRAAYVGRLYEQIEERWTSSREDVADFIAELRSLGGSLFDDLFPSDLQRALWDNRDALTSIQVISTEPFIPWELVHLKEPGQPLPDESLFLAELGLVRWLHGSVFPETVRIRPGRARYVVPDYPHPDDKLPEARAEMRFLERSLAATAVEPQPAAIRKLLRGPGAFDLVHFACHGQAESDDIGHAALVLEGRVENGNAVPAFIDVTTVRETSRLQDDDGNRPMVVLNACQIGRMGFTLTRVGGFAEAFLRRGAGAFIGSLWSVGDRSARTFTETLYGELKNGSTLSEAAIRARATAAREGDATWLAYAVYGHPDMRLVIA